MLDSQLQTILISSNNLKQTQQDSSHEIRVQEGQSTGFNHDPMDLNALQDFNGYNKNKHMNNN